MATAFRPQIATGLPHGVTCPGHEVTGPSSHGTGSPMAQTESPKKDVLIFLSLHCQLNERRQNSGRDETKLYRIISRFLIK